jgi:hypothetical protein
MSLVIINNQKMSVATKSSFGGALGAFICNKLPVSLHPVVKVDLLARSDELGGKESDSKISVHGPLHIKAFRGQHFVINYNNAYVI